MVQAKADGFPAGLFTPKESAAARGLGARDLEDLVRIPPRRYAAPGPLRDLRHLSEGEDISVIVTVERTRERTMKNRRGTLLDVRVRDDEGESIQLTFFLFKAHLVSWHMSRLREGTRVLVSGTVSRYRGENQIAHPDYVLLAENPSAEEERDIAKALEPAPVYPLRGSATQKLMRAVFAKALRHASDLREVIPAAIRRERNLPSIHEAARLLHAPHESEDVERALRYFRFEEAFIIQSIFARRRAQDVADSAPALATYGALSRALDERLPFQLTPSQEEVGEQIAERIAESHPTSLLLQGDVGSGKTVVALRAMARAVDSGYQAVLLAPTEVLARQHYSTITTMLGDLARRGHLDAHEAATRVRLLVGAQKASERRESLLDLMSGEAGIAVGTHALLTDNVDFLKLGLVIIDEQHRFGVDHRRQLRMKGPGELRPHMMVMTATPIPRSAALALVGDLDSLTLKGRPREGADVSSFVVPLGDDVWRERMWERALEEIRAGRQVFVVCPRIDPDEAAEVGEVEASGAPPVLSLGIDHPLHAVTPTLETLRAKPGFEPVRIEELHGRLSSDLKRERMEAFAAGEIDVLVATTVIEVGVDVPNASVMIVLDAERFGLAQLHQLRGRIGRGEQPGIAFFATQFGRGSAQHAGLTELAGTTDGFALAELDLERRGGGDLVGDIQSGTSVAVRFLDVGRDARMILEAREDALVTEALARGSLTTSSLEPPTPGELDALDAAIARHSTRGVDDLERS
ncbi:ATP-dependent DNA helicase RecG [Dermabacter sp. p3-SID358]|uniref:ATP-dependent DNA helicase RecG n=1 Tax=Dermabacter sp. p3-SID358 TaxID=2916114 RepID=UPI0021A45A7C|nr:ATP-dependent DNA helicase RecG [Dermabacter sp. p3-SID358]MCT1866545.1 ATP-dependent DNA helicase RecG [Dermabacter sp. p3-SID358]